MMTAMRPGLVFLAVGLAVGLGVACAAGSDDDTGSGGNTTSTTGTGATGLTTTSGGGQGATTTSTTNTTTTGSGGGATGEDCLNGVDDDGDLLIDCADSECQAAGYECVPAFGTTVEFVGLFPAAPCPTGSTALGLRSCDGCTCDADPGSCNVDVELCDANCNNCVAPLTTPGCRNVTPDEVRSVRGLLEPRNDDSCVAGPDTAQSNELTACALPVPGRCPSGNHCVPPELAAAPERCVLLDGEGSCPGAYVESRIVFPEQANTCACGCAWGDQSCQPISAVISHDADDCTGNTQSIALDEGCHPAGTVASVTVPAVTAIVQCERSATPIGNVTKRTLCCLP